MLLPGHGGTTQHAGRNIGNAGTNRARIAEVWAIMVTEPETTESRR